MIRDIAVAVIAGLILVALGYKASEKGDKGQLQIKNEIKVINQLQAQPAMPALPVAEEKKEKAAPAKAQEEYSPSASGQTKETGLLAQRANPERVARAEPAAKEKSPQDARPDSAPAKTYSHTLSVNNYGATISPDKVHLTFAVNNLSDKPVLVAFMRPGGISFAYPKDTGRLTEVQGIKSMDGIPRAEEKYFTRIEPHGTANVYARFIAFNYHGEIGTYNIELLQLIDGVIARGTFSTRLSAAQ